MLPESLRKKLSALLESRGSFFRGVLTLVSGTLISRLIALIAIPVLARIYTPAEFGVMALFVTIGSLVASFACARYDMAVVLPERHRDGLFLLIASLAIAAVVSLVSMLVFGIFSADIARWLKSPELSLWLWLSPVLIFFHSAFIALRSWAARTESFGGVSSAMVGNTLVSVAVQFFLVFPQRLADGGLIIGRLAGSVAQAFILLRYGWDEIRKAAAGGFDWARTRELLYRYRDFPKYDAGANFLNESSRELPILLLGLFFNPVIVGFYSVGRRMLGMPVQLFSAAIAQVFFPKAAEAYAAGTLGPLARGVFERLTIAAVTPMMVGIMVMDEVVAVFLGSNWTESSVYVQWLSLAIMVTFITAPFAQLFNVLEKQRARLVYVTAMTLIQIAVLTVAGSMGDSVAAVAGFSVVSAVGTMSNYLWLLRKAGVGLRLTLRVLAREAVFGLPFAALALLAHRHLTSNIAVLVVVVPLLGGFFLLRMQAVMGRR